MVLKRDSRVFLDQFQEKLDKINVLDNYLSSRDSIYIKYHPKILNSYQLYTLTLSCNARMVVYEQQYLYPYVEMLGFEDDTNSFLQQVTCTCKEFSCC